MLVLLGTGFLPIVGLEFAWLNIHWIAGLILILCILYHIVHASFFLDFWSIWILPGDLKEAVQRTKRQLGQSVEYLIVKQDVKEPTFREHMASVFLPFTGELWAVCIVFLAVFGIAFALLERGGGDFEDDSSPFVSSMYMSFFSGVSGGPAYAPITPGGRIIMLGFAWLLLISLASYTANLASILVVANSVQGITGMADGDTPFITKDGAKLCVPHESVVSCRSAARTPA